MLAITAIALTGAVPAHAALDSEMAAYMEIARAEHAEVSGACAGIAVRFESPAYFVREQTEHHPEVFGRLVGLGGACSIWLDREWFAAAKWEEACGLVAHEAGHAYGLPHSEDPASVMHHRTWRGWRPCIDASPAIPLRQAASRASRRALRFEDRCWNASARRIRARACEGERRAWNRVRALERRLKRLE